MATSAKDIRRGLAAFKQHLFLVETAIAAGKLSIVMF
jgi:hypothetical protein